MNTSKEAKRMTMTIFIVLRRMTETAREEQVKERDIEVEEIRIRDPDSAVEEAPIPVPEADDEDGEEEWPEGDDGPDHYGWEEVYELNGCSPDYL